MLGYAGGQCPENLTIASGDPFFILSEPSVLTPEPRRNQCIISAEIEPSCG